MDFMEIANARQSCRSYDPERPVEREKIEAILEAGRLAPSACNGQPYHITVCTGEKAKAVAQTAANSGFLDSISGWTVATVWKFSCSTPETRP